MVHMALCKKQMKTNLAWTQCIQMMPVREKEQSIWWYSEHVYFTKYIKIKYKFSSVSN